MAAGGKESDLSPPRPAAGPPAPWTTPALAMLYFFSGATGLCYEVLWARMLSAQFGASIFGVAVTVGAFLLGLGIGALLGSGRAARASPLRALGTFALLELAVAAYALALPAINGALGPVLEGAATRLGWGPWFALQAAVALLLLAVPAAAMGASFPMVLRAAPVTPLALGRIYALNSLGAALGALASVPLLALLGWPGALRAVAALGVLVAAAAALLAAFGADFGAQFASARAQAPEPTGGVERTGRAPARLLLAYAGVGACALVLEIGWTRLYGMVMLRTEYVLALILGIYLLGTAAGAMIAAHAARARWLAVAVPVVACAWTLLGLWVLPTLAVWLQEQHFASLRGALGADALVLMACTLPTSAALGAWLPLLAHHAGAGEGARTPLDLRPRGAAGVALYGANCLGAALGAVYTVTIGIAYLGTTASIALAAVLLLALGALLGAPRRLALALPLAMGAAWAVHDFPAPQRMLAPAAAPGVERYRYEDALTLNHVTQAPSGQLTLLTDLQHMDASSDPAAVQIQADQARLPLLLHGAPRSILFLGLGTGISATGSLPYSALARTAVELSPGAIGAARTWFAPVNGNVMRTMAVEHDDARHYLAARAERYDVIVGDLFHPDLAGMSRLLSVEQFARARAHLAGHGVFAQWIALNQFDRESLHTVLRSFQQVFPDAQIFLDGMHLAMIGSPDRLAAAPALAANLAAMTPEQADAATGGEGSATWLGRYWGPIAAGTGPVESETRPVIEFRLPRLRYDDDAPLAQLMQDLLRQRPDVATAAARLGVAPAEQTAFASAYVASELAMQSWLAALAGDAQGARRLTRLGYEANPRDHWIASALADDYFSVATATHALDQPGALERVLRIFPDHVEALRALWHRERAAGHLPQAQAALRQLRALAPLDSEVAAQGGS